MLFWRKGYLLILVLGFLVLSLFSFLVFLPQSTPAQFFCTHYVATTGNDANPGTQNQPWRTIQKAADSVVPGNVVCVRGGTYAGVTITRSGTETAPITFRVAAGEGVTVTSGF